MSAESISLQNSTLERLDEIISAMQAQSKDSALAKQKAISRAEAIERMIMDYKVPETKSLDDMYYQSADLLSNQKSNWGKKS